MTNKIVAGHDILELQCVNSPHSGVADVPVNPFLDPRFD
jgi:hypothetical protein